MLKITKLNIDGGKLREDYHYCVIDTETPVFSWSVLSSDTNNKQQSCRVTVYADETLLWDSGWIEQTEQSLKYAGEALPHGRILTAEITVRDRYGVESEPYLRHVSTRKYLIKTNDLEQY